MALTFLDGKGAESLNAAASQWDIAFFMKLGLFCTRNINTISSVLN